MSLRRSLAPRALALAALLALPFAALTSDRVASAPAAPPAPPAHAVLGTYVRGPTRLVAGTPAALRVATHWATDEKTSGPFAGVSVEATLAGGGRRATLFRGRTDAAGLADARFQVPAWPEGEYTLEVASDGAGRHDAHAQKIELASSAKVLLESDKPLYQPAQVIHLRAIAVRPQDGRPLASGKLTFEVSDPRGNRVFREERTASEFGVASADFALADEIALGTYRARALLARPGAEEADVAGTLDLRVERYALPKFKVAAEPDRGWYAPGERVRLSLDARYFFGKPVAGGDAVAKVRVGDAVRVALPTQRVKLDGDGKARIEIELSSKLDVDEAPLDVDVEVTDGARHVERASRAVLVSRQPSRLEITAEAGVLIAGVDNRVWVTATEPDGTPLADQPIQLALARGPAQSARTDAIGVASFTVHPDARPSTAGCVRGQVELRAQPAAGPALERCLSITDDGMLVRTDRAIYPSGAPIAVEVLGSDGIAFLDVVKEGQTVDTAAVEIRNGHGSLQLAADERRFGTLVLRAYRIAPDGRQTHDSRLIFVDRPGALRVSVRPEGAAGATFRPGERGRIRLKVVDAASGAPARASVGVVMVDQALLALRAVRPGAARTYFSLADEATRPGARMKARPGGYTVEKLVDEQLDSLKDEAARILLAGAAPPWALGFEIDPWALRERAWEEQLPRMGAALERFSHTHDLGERVPGSRAAWRYRADLIGLLASEGAIPARDRKDPWGRRVAPEPVIEASGLGPFDAWATATLDDRLTAIYQSLSANRALLAADAAATGKRRAFTVGTADLERLAAAGKLARHLLHDPWGAPWRVEERKRPLRIGHLWSRFVLASAGPDGAPATADDRFPIDETWGPGATVAVRGADRKEFAAFAGRAIGDAYGVGGLGLTGTGRGGGGTGEGTIGLGHLGTIGHGAGGGEAARVRTSFPETMLWRPEVVTDAAGEAVIEAEMADSVTTWRLAAEAIAADGRLGFTTTEVRVFQDFFADIDLPPALTQHDEIAVPVAVYNYLKTPERVTLTLESAPWFRRQGDAAQSIDLQPSEVGVRYFRIAVDGVGVKKLLVRAQGRAAADAIERAVEIFPDGVERALSFQDRLDAATPARHRLDIPPDAIADASMAQLKVYPGMATHVIEGLDSMLHMPGGCFEQTSSTTYPNALVLDYLRRSKKSTPAVEKKATTYLAAGYQRLLSFEVKGGGFSWFGQAPANKILTAYGLEEFHDMARVHPVDERVIARTRDWLTREQRPDGTWAPDTYFINEGATNRFNRDVLRITAYIAVALRHTGARGPAVDKARAWVRRELERETPKDPYTLALCAELLHDDASPVLDALLEKLWTARQDEGKGTSFVSREKTPTYGDGRSGTVETTALAASSLLEAHAPLARVDRAIAYLLNNKDTFGSWYSTQATIRSLKALLEYQSHRTSRARGTLTVRVGGAEVARLPVDTRDDALQQVSLAAATAPGAHDVQLTWDGTGEVAYQLVGRWYQPRTAAPAPAAVGLQPGAEPRVADLTVETHLDRTELAQGGKLLEEVRVATSAAADMPIVTAGLPPGFDLDGEDLDRLVKAGTVEKVQRTPREVIFYLRALDPAHPLTLPLHLTSRMPARVAVPPATVYEYYRPERRAAGAPLTVTVRG
jgi:A-macroglobulin TED domain/Alpha-2-macroglobulin family/MG2 domain/A-macroglobulin receptor binding domain/Macroglobulin domain MG3